MNAFHTTLSSLKYRSERSVFRRTQFVFFLVPLICSLIASPLWFTVARNALPFRYQPPGRDGARYQNQKIHHIHVCRDKALHSPLSHFHIFPASPTNPSVFTLSDAEWIWGFSTRCSADEARFHFMLDVLQQRFHGASVKREQQRFTSFNSWGLGAGETMLMCKTVIKVQPWPLTLWKLLISLSSILVSLICIQRVVTACNTECYLKIHVELSEVWPWVENVLKSKFL